MKVRPIARGPGEADTYAVRQLVAQTDSMASGLRTALAPCRGREVRAWESSSQDWPTTLEAMDVMTDPKEVIDL